MSNDSYFSVHNYFDMEAPNGRLIPVSVRIGVDTLPEELEICLRMVSKGRFISYPNIPVVELMIYMLLEKLQIYYWTFPDEARIAAERMIQILQAVDADDDFFPSTQIADIKAIAHIV